MFIEVHDATEDSLCERIRPGYSWYDGYDIDGCAKDAADYWRGQAKEIWFFDGEKPPKGQKFHDMKPYKIMQIGEI